jgi:hypothetical protein
MTPQPYDVRNVPAKLAPVHRGSLGRTLVVAVGICLGQAILYGPSLVGAKILLPLDILAEPTVYLPRTAAMEKTTPHDFIRSDMVFFYEPERQFAVREVHAGRLPLWSPYRFAGTPCLRWCLSPPFLPGYLIASPVVLAWIQLLIALVAGGGAYVFFRRVLGVRFWPAAIAAWCYPLSGAYIVWQGFWLPAVMCWLPWVLLAVDETVRRPFGWGGPCLAVLTTVVILGGAPSISGQLLLTSGVYALWRCVELYGIPRPSRPWLTSAAMTVMAWGLGILASTWLLLPAIEYVETGARTIARSQGAEERPPVGWKAIPEVVFPQIYGSTQNGSWRIAAYSLPESAAGAYAGLLATLFVAPLAWCGRRRWSANAVWVVIGFVALGWSLDMPGVVHLLRLPGLNMMSHNRWVFVAAFAILALAAVGLDSLWQGEISRRWWFVLPVVLLAGLCGWCLYRAAVLPEPIATEIGAAMRAGRPIGPVNNAAAVLRVQQGFVCSYGVAAALSAAAMIAWGWLSLRGRLHGWLRGVLAALLVGELLWFGYGRAGQCAPALYYPRVPILERIAKSVPGRIIGFNCLPVNLSQTQGLCDVRGYDGVDPARLIDILKPATRLQSRLLPYALTQWATPEIALLPSGGWRLSPILDMLNVRYVVFRGSPSPQVKPDMQDLDYWVLTNSKALPRAFVPEHVEAVPCDRDRLRLLAAAEFDPRRVAYVERPVGLPAACRGSAAILAETPTRVSVSLKMDTPALVVLADRWDQGWNAYLDGVRTPMLRANHALRGVVTPAGQRILQFRYEPASLGWGARLSGLAAVAWIVWVVAIAWAAKRRAQNSAVSISRVPQTVAASMRWILVGQIACRHEESNVAHKPNRMQVEPHR